MSAADLLEDGFPHGTVDGYRQGCRGSACPGELDFGLSCRRAKQLDAGDIRYGRLVRQGLTPAQIAAELGETTHEHPAPAPRRTVVPDDDQVEDLDEPIEGEDPIMTTIEETAAPSPATIVKNRKPEPQPAPEWPDEPAAQGDENSGENSGTGKTPTPGEIRAWARENGIPVNPRGNVRTAVVEAYNLAHGHITVDVPADVPAETDAVVGEPFDPATAAALNAEADGEPDLPIPSTPGTRDGIAPDGADIAEALQHVVFHGPVADMETRAELFNEGWDEARKQSVEVAIESLAESLEFALRQWAAAVDRARAAEARADAAERDLVDARRPWWKRRAA